jgi:hypothetical protein
VQLSVLLEKRSSQRHRLGFAATADLSRFAGTENLELAVEINEENL